SDGTTASDASAAAGNVRWRTSLRSWSKALRLHQWIKNLLIFVPLVAVHRLASTHDLFAAAVAFVCFGLCASSVYVLNDLLDLRDDRRHPVKRWRPFASGALPLMSGWTAFPLLLAASFGGALLFLPTRFAAVLLGYYALTCAYSFRLKKVMMLDVIA